jgi:hypothetical protein
MTAQTPDYVRYQDEQYDIVGVKGSGLVEPRKMGITHFIMSTGCWRGHYCTYKIAAGQLFLAEMAVGYDEALPIDGIVPVEDGYENVYKGLKIPVSYTGGLLVGKNFIDSMYVHMGFQKPHTFEKLMEFRFDQGKLIEINDHSARMAGIRQKIAEERLAWENAHRAEHEEIAHLRKQVNELSEKIAASRKSVSDNELHEEYEAVREAIEPEISSLNARIHALYETLYPPPTIEWVQYTFSLNYDL